MKHKFEEESPKHSHARARAYRQKLLPELPHVVLVFQRDDSVSVCPPRFFEQLVTHCLQSLQPLRPRGKGCGWMGQRVNWELNSRHRLTYHAVTHATIYGTYPPTYPLMLARMHASLTHTLDPAPVIAPQPRSFALSTGDHVRVPALHRHHLIVCGGNFNDLSVHTRIPQVVLRHKHG